jgi:hypothetical protein
MHPDDPAATPRPEPSRSRRDTSPPAPADGGRPVDGAVVGLAPRDYPVSSEDRNTKRSEDDWPAFTGGAQRVAVPGAPPVDGEGTERSSPN